jgi:hypothetical protein
LRQSNGTAPVEDNHTRGHSTQSGWRWTDW